MKRKNILLISQSMSVGGAEKVIANLSLELAGKFNIYIITYSQDDKEYVYAGERLDIDCPGGNVPFIKKVNNLLYRCQVVKKYKKKWDIDVSISFVPQTDIVNVLTRTPKEKIVIEVSSNTSVAFPTKRSKIARKKVLKMADEVVAVSKGAMRDLEENFEIKRECLSVIYNSCDIEVIQKNCRTKLHEKSDIVAVGSFRKPKGHWHLIKAFSVISKKFPDTKLIILGDGPYREKYEELISKLKINRDQVKMPGFCVNPHIYMANAKLFVFSSIYEGFGNVIIEAMACGTPIISADCNYGPREILAPDTDILYRTKTIELGEFGCIVPPFGDADIEIDTNISKEERLLASAMEQFLLDDKLRNTYINKGLERCKEFDIKGFGEEWEKLLLKLE